MCGDDCSAVSFVVSVTPAALQRHREQLARLLRQRPAQRELVERNIICLKTEQERREDRERIGIKLNRRLSLRPTADELEQKNILHSMSLGKLYFCEAAMDIF